MAHLSKPTGDPLADAMRAFRQFYESMTATPFDGNLNMAHYSEWAYLHNSLTSTLQREAIVYYSRLWGNAGLNYE